MKFKHDLILRRVTQPGQLSASEREQVVGQPELVAVLDENRALADLAGPSLTAPSREALLSLVYERTAHHKEKPMTLLNRLFAGRPWYARFALACLILLALVATSQFLPSREHPRPGPAPAYAESNGYLLVYDFGARKIEEVQSTVDQLKEQVRAFKKEHGLQEEDATWESRVGVIARQVGKSEETVGAGAVGEVQPQHSTQALEGGAEGSRLVCFVTLEDSALLEQLSEQLKSISGLPAPQTVEATWFAQEGLPLPGADGIQVGLGLGHKQHMFTFPANATETEMEQAINEWLKQNHPDMQFSVDVSLSEQDGKKEVRVEIRGAGHEAAAEAGAG